MTARAALLRAQHPRPGDHPPVAAHRDQPLGRPGERQPLRLPAQDRVLDVEYFLDSLRRVAAGGSALDPEVVSRLIGAHRQEAPLESLTPREHDVLALMAEGRTNVGIARRLWVSERTIETHVANIMIKLGLDSSDEDHRRVLAVLRFLGHGQS
jgi:serine/threonine-protein kinase PknK